MTQQYMQLIKNHSNCAFWHRVVACLQHVWFEWLGTGRLFGKPRWKERGPGYRECRAGQRSVLFLAVAHCIIESHFIVMELIMLLGGIFETTVRESYHYLGSVEI